MKKFILVRIALIHLAFIFFHSECISGTIMPPYTVTATQSYLGVFGKCKVTIDYAPGATSIRKALIIFEGFDPGHITNPESESGVTDYELFRYDLNSTSSNLKDLLISSQEYDIVYVDWVNGTDYIQRNAYAAEAVIKDINLKQAQAGLTTNPIVILGLSMGGLCARYALKHMEDNAVMHRTRLFVTYDTPHQGANVPIGYQYLANHGRHLFSNGDCWYCS